MTEFVLGAEDGTTDGGSWTELNPLRGEVLEVYMPRTNVANAGDFRAAFLVFGTRILGDGSMLVSVKCMGCEDVELFQTIQRQMNVRGGSLHLCLSSPCAFGEEDEEARQAIHVTHVRRWEFIDIIDADYISRSMRTQSRGWYAEIMGQEIGRPARGPPEKKKKAKKPPKVPAACSWRRSERLKHQNTWFVRGRKGKAETAAATSSGAGTWYRCYYHGGDHLRWRRRGDSAYVNRGRRIFICTGTWETKQTRQSLSSYSSSGARRLESQGRIEDEEEEDGTTGEEEEEREEESTGRRTKRRCSIGGYKRRHFKKLEASAGGKGRAGVGNEGKRQEEERKQKDVPLKEDPGGVVSDPYWVEEEEGQEQRWKEKEEESCDERWSDRELQRELKRRVFRSEFELFRRDGLGYPNEEEKQGYTRISACDAREPRQGAVGSGGDDRTSIRGFDTDLRNSSDDVLHAASEAEFSNESEGATRATSSSGLHRCAAKRRHSSHWRRSSGEIYLDSSVATGFKLGDGEAYGVVPHGGHNCSKRIDGVGNPKTYQVDIESTKSTGVELLGRLSRTRTRKRKGRLVEWLRLQGRERKKEKAKRARKEEKKWQQSEYDQDWKANKEKPEDKKS